jgi:hypothetical protein
MPVASGFPLTMAISRTPGVSRSTTLIDARPMRKMRTKVAKVLRSTHPKPDRKTAGSAQGGGCGGTTWPRTEAGRAKTAINTRRLNHMYIKMTILETIINFYIITGIILIFELTIQGYIVDVEGDGYARSLS